ncbi:TIGR02677 family protein [Pueribacillus theae]|nr:TIGR02677 family protein [Pueribacillus theae]
MVEFRYNEENDTYIGLQRMRSYMTNTPEQMWIRPVPELKYLNAENVHRYRLLMRYFYQQYKKLRYWLSPEEVYQGVLDFGLIKDYTLEQCQQDLESLTEWQNLTNRHDGSKASTVEEYLRKKFRYLLTPYSIEIERMLENLESIQGYGGSLEASLFDQIVEWLKQINDMLDQDKDFEGALDLWKSLSGAFKQLHENASDYLASLQTGKAEELMMTESFLVFKDTLTHYLRNFIQGMQKSSYKIEGYLRKISLNEEQLLDKITAEQERLPNLEDDRTHEERHAQFEAEWQSFKRWFLGEGNELSDLYYLEQATKETISKIVRAVLRIQEKRRLGTSRKRELDYLGQWFFAIDELEEAKELAAYTFGLYKTRHFQGWDEPMNDSGHSSMWDESPMIRHLRSRSRKQIKRQQNEPVRQTKQKQNETREIYLQKQKEEVEIIEQLLEKEQFSVSDLKDVSRPLRNLLLYWIGRCSSHPSRNMDTPDGVRIELKMPDNEKRTKLTSNDGELELPDFAFKLMRIQASSDDINKNSHHLRRNYLDHANEQQAKISGM